MKVQDRRLETLQFHYTEATLGKSWPTLQTPSSCVIWKTWMTRIILGKMTYNNPEWTSSCLSSRCPVFLSFCSGDEPAPGIWLQGLLCSSSCSWLYHLGVTLFCLSDGLRHRHVEAQSVLLERLGGEGMGGVACGHLRSQQGAALTQSTACLCLLKTIIPSTKHFRILFSF